MWFKIKFEGKNDFMRKPLITLSRSFFYQLKGKLQPQVNRLEVELDLLQTIRIGNSQIINRFKITL